MRDFTYTSPKGRFAVPKDHRSPPEIPADDLMAMGLILLGVVLIAYLLNWLDSRYKNYLCEVCHADTTWICLTCNACYEHCCCGPEDPPEEERVA